MTITIKEHTPGGDIDDFVRAGHVVFAGDPMDHLPQGQGEAPWWLRPDMSINDLAHAVA